MKGKEEINLIIKMMKKDEEEGRIMGNINIVKKEKKIG